MRALHAAKAGAEELRRKWPKNDPDGLAVAIGALRASFGA
jgi:hypothetical protein